jgi:hypothetical protein
MTNTVTTNSGAVLTLSIVGEAATMSGGKFGSHVVEGSPERIAAHWEGYVEVNGGTVAKVTKPTKPMFIQNIARQFDVVCTPKFPTWNARSFTVRVLAWNKADANKLARRDTYNATHGTAYMFKAFPVPGHD